MRQAGHVRRFPPAVDLHGCDDALRMADRIIAFFVVPHGSGWAPSVLAGDGVALLVAVIGERLAVVDEGFLQSDVLAVGLGLSLIHILCSPSTFTSFCHRRVTAPELKRISAGSPSASVPRMLNSSPRMPSISRSRPSPAPGYPPSQVWKFSSISPVA